MPVPLAIGAVAALAYLNARSSFTYDLRMLNCAITGIYRVLSSDRRDRLNAFYDLERRAQSSSHAAKTFLWFEGRTYSYADVYDLAVRYGTWLKQKHGVRARDIVAMDMVNSDDFVLVWFALWAVGAKPAFINYNLTGKPLSHCLQAAGAKLCIVDPAVAADKVTDEVRAENPQVEFVSFTEDARAEAASTHPVRSPDEDRSEKLPSDMAMLIYTSGTTGMPKPAIVSWLKVIVGASIAQRFLGRGGDDIMYTSMPLYHSSASILSLCTTLYSGSTQALGRKFSTKLFWDDVRASRATMIQYVGETLRYLLAAPPQHDPATGECLDRKHDVRIAFGNGLRPDIWNRFKDRFGVEEVAEFFAATEGPVSLWNRSANDFSAGAMGRHGWIYQLITSFTMAVAEVDWDTDMPRRDPATGLCRRVRAGEPGELLSRLDPSDPSRRYQGYYGNEAASQSKILRDVFKKGDMWYRTGDVVRWDAEGRVYFHDRIGDTFRWKSENVSTAEVSQVLGLHPAVREANVYGVALPHHDGRAGCAWVWLTGGSTTGASSGDIPSSSTMQSLAQHVRAQLPTYAQPLFLRVHTGDDQATGQTTGTNKQQKHNLRGAGVKPQAAGGADEGAMGKVFWLRGGGDKDKGYVPFGEGEWNAMEAGRVKL